jgi:hypothetical protein
VKLFSKDSLIKTIPPLFSGFSTKISAFPQTPAISYRFLMVQTVVRFPSAPPEKREVIFASRFFIFPGGFHSIKIYL